MERLNVFVIALDAFNKPLLERLRGAGEIAFHPLLTTEEVVISKTFDMPRLLDKARGRLRSFEGEVDAVVGYWDFPTSTMLPVLRREFGLRGPSIESVLKCEHKYWSRLEQQRVFPDDTPEFAVINPFLVSSFEPPPMAFPFWVKPVRAHSSMLGFKVENRDDLRAAMATSREHIHRLAEPFNHLMSYARLPPDIQQVDGFHCLAEEIISAGDQCTLEGYVLDGRVQVYGAVDSLREGPSESSFTRYQYPSRLGPDVLGRMEIMAEQFLHQVGFDNSAFNIEYFHDPVSGRIWLLEVNTRLSKSHAPLFELVDGVANYQVMVDVALGREPGMPKRQGHYSCAAKFMLRKHEDATVLAAPTADERRQLEAEIPGVHILIGAEPGMRLQHLQHQDSYSFELATVFVGANSSDELEAKGRQCQERLRFRFNDTEQIGFN